MTGTTITQGTTVGELSLPYQYITEVNGREIAVDVYEWTTPPNIPYFEGTDLGSYMFCAESLWFHGCANAETTMGDIEAAVQRSTWRVEK